MQCIRTVQSEVNNLTKIATTVSFRLGKSQYSPILCTLCQKHTICLYIKSNGQSSSQDSEVLNTFWGKDQHPEIWGRGSLLESGGMLETKSSSIPGKYPPSTVIGRTQLESRDNGGRKLSSVPFFFFLMGSATFISSIWHHVRSRFCAINLDCWFLCQCN